MNPTANLNAHRRVRSRFSAASIAIYKIGARLNSSLANAHFSLFWVLGQIPPYPYRTLADSQLLGLIGQAFCVGGGDRNGTWNGWVAAGSSWHLAVGGFVRSATRWVAAVHAPPPNCQREQREQRETRNPGQPTPAAINAPRENIRRSGSPSLRQIQ